MAVPRGENDVSTVPGDRLNAFEVFGAIRRCKRDGRAMSVIRLGDGEGAVMGYPTITNRKDVNRSLRIWLRTIDVPDRDVLRLAEELKEAIRNADIVGVPRPRQIASDLHLWQAVTDALEHFQLIGEEAALTHTALHRLLQHGLLFRPLLKGADFVGVISCRRVMDALRELFGVAEVEWYGVRGELEDTGEILTPHFPEGFEEIRATLRVPHPGALFLVGAGVFGKIYCHWIKERGGVAVDVGSILDSWAGEGRVGHPVRSLDEYRNIPRIGREEAIARYNALADQFGLDVPRGDPDAAYCDELPSAW